MLVLLLVVPLGWKSGKDCVRHSGNSKAELYSVMGKYMGSQQEVKEGGELQ